MTELMDRQVASEAFQTAIGEARVDALVFCTHDLDPSFFEEDVLPVFIGSDLRHTRRTRQFQLDYEIRSRDLAIDVYYEARALAAHEGGARLGWHRVWLSGRAGGVFHPKIVLALCTTTDGEEQLVVGIGSGNLTRGGWYTNVECLDVEAIVDGHRHGYVDGLQQLVEQLHRESQGRQRPATDKVRAFLARQTPFAQRTSQGVLRPTVLPGWVDLPAALRGLFGRRLDGAHLEIVSPFIDESPMAPGSALSRFASTFYPRTVRVCRPVKDGATRLPEATFRAIADSPDVDWASLPSGYTRAASGVESGDRGLHAKMYRFWRGGKDRIEVIVVGSHNLTNPAHRGTSNFEVSVVQQVDRHFTALLEVDDAEPDEFGDTLADEEADPSDEPMPLSVEHDWLTGVSRYRWEAARPPARVTLSRVGADVATLQIESARRWSTAPSDVTRALETSLRSSAVLTAALPSGRRGPILVEEVNHAAKPALLDGVTLTAAEILILWSLPDVRSRQQRIADYRTKTSSDEDDVEIAESAPGAEASMFDKFAGVFHAFACMRQRVEELAVARRTHDAAIQVYGQNFDSPRSALELSLSEPEPDLALAYVTFACAEELHRGLRQRHPGVVDVSPHLVQSFEQLLKKRDAIRRQLVDAEPDGDGPELEKFLRWFDRHFTRGTR